MEDGFAKLTESIDILNISELIGRLELNGLNELLNKLIELSGLTELNELTGLMELIEF